MTNPENMMLQEGIDHRRETTSREQSDNTAQRKTQVKRDLDHKKLGEIQGGKQSQRNKLKTVEYLTVGQIVYSETVANPGVIHEACPGMSRK